MGTITVSAMLLVAAMSSPPRQDPPGPGLPAAPILEEIAATQAFERRTGEYARLHRLLEAELPPLPPTTDVARIHLAVGALRYRIQLARQGAAQGDLLSPDVVRLVRHVIATCLTPDEWAAVLADSDEEAREAGGVAPPILRVNTAWPQGVTFDVVPPQLLRDLPALPPELQYRIIGRSLVLWDHHADLIIDFVPGIFAGTT